MSKGTITRLFSDQNYPLEYIINRASSRSFLYFLSVETLIIGAWAEDVYGRDFFARSGAVLALIGLFLLWLWLKYSDELKSVDLSLQNAEKLRATSKSIGKDVTNLNDMKLLLEKHLDRPTKAEKEQLALAMHKVLIEGPNLKTQLNLISSNLGHAQIEVAALGTFIWAFGDLLV